MGQKTGRDAHIVARLTSNADSTMGELPYQVGSKVGDVAARFSTKEMRRNIEQMFTLWVC